MPRHLLTLLVVLTALAYLACAPGPEPRPVAEAAPPSGEETAKVAAEAADEPRDDVLYATSTPDDEVDDEEPELADVDDKPFDRVADKPVATLYIDDEGRFVTEEGDEVDLEALDELSDAPLQDRAIEVIVPGKFGTVDEEYDLIVDVIDAAEREGAFILIVTEEESEDELDKTDEEGDEEFDESDEADDDE